MMIITPRTCITATIIITTRTGAAETTLQGTLPPPQAGATEEATTATGSRVSSNNEATHSSPTRAATVAMEATREAQVGVLVAASTISRTNSSSSTIGGSIRTAGSTTISSNKQINRGSNAHRNLSSRIKITEEGQKVTICTAAVKAVSSHTNLKEIVEEA
jgi:hypothetical protein